MNKNGELGSEHQKRKQKTQKQLTESNVRKSGRIKNSTKWKSLLPTRNFFSENFKFDGRRNWYFFFFLFSFFAHLISQSFKSATKSMGSIELRSNLFYLFYSKRLKRLVFRKHFMFSLLRNKKAFHSIIQRRFIMRYAIDHIDKMFVWFFVKSFFKFKTCSANFENFVSEKWIVHHLIWFESVLMMQSICIDFENNFFQTLVIQCLFFVQVWIEILKS